MIYWKLRPPSSDLISALSAWYGSVYILTYIQLQIYSGINKLPKLVCTVYRILVLCLWDQKENFSFFYSASKVPLIIRVVLRQARAGGWDCVSVTLNHTMLRLIRMLSVLHRSHIWIPLSRAPTSDSHMDLMVDWVGDGASRVEGALWLLVERLIINIL